VGSAASEGACTGTRTAASVIHVEGGVVTVDFVRVSMRVREAKPSKRQATEVERL